MADFTKYNYDDIVKAVTDFLKDSDGFGDGYDSSTGQMLIRAIAQITNQLHYMLERRTQENFMPTARLRSSVLSLASQNAYRPRRVVSANGYVSIQLTDRNGAPVAPEGNVFFPKYTELTFEDKKFVIAEDVTIPAGQAAPVTDVKIIEGVKRSMTFDPNEPGSTLKDKNFIVIKDYDRIEETSLEIFTGNQIYTDVTQSIDGNPPIAAISFASPTDAVYDVRITNDGMTIIFGDNTFGMKPDGLVTVNWIESSGTAVDIVAVNQEFKLNSETVGDDIIKTPPNTYYYRITNTTKITNALDAETIDRIKKTAPDYVRTANRAVTDNDYSFWVKRSGIGGIVDAKVYGQADTGIDPYTANNVYIVYLTRDGSELSAQEKDELRKYLRYYNHLTTHPVFEQADEVKAQVNIRIKRNPLLAMANSQLYDIVLGELKRIFSLEEGALGASIFHSDLVSHFKNYTVVSGGKNVNIADWVSVDVKALKPFSSPIYVQTIDIPVTAGAPGDNYTIKINGEPYTYIQQAGDTANSIAEAMRALVNADGNADAYVDGNVITIQAEVEETAFTISNSGTSVPENMPVTQTVTLPPSALNNPTGDDLFVRGSIEIIDTSGLVVSRDNSAGLMSSGGTIDYATGEMVIPILPEGDYYVRYLQDTDKNLIANKRVALTLLEPKADYNEMVETFSTIEIL